MEYAGGNDEFLLQEYYVTRVFIYKIKIHVIPAHRGILLCVKGTGGNQKWH